MKVLFENMTVEVTNEDTQKKIKAILIHDLIPQTFVEKQPKAAVKVSQKLGKKKKKVRNDVLMAHKPWTPEENGLLVRMVAQGKEFFEIARHLGRTESSVKVRLYLLNQKNKKVKTAEVTQGHTPVRWNPPVLEPKTSEQELSIAE